MRSYYATVSYTLYIDAENVLEARYKAMLAFNERLDHKTSDLRLSNSDGIEIGELIYPSQLR